MISRSTMGDIVHALRCWCDNHEIDRELLHNLLLELATIEGNQSFAQSMKAISREFGGEREV